MKRHYCLINDTISQSHIMLLLINVTILHLVIQADNQVCNSRAKCNIWPDQPTQSYDFSLKDEIWKET